MTRLNSSLLDVMRTVLEGRPRRSETWADLVRGRVWRDLEAVIGATHGLVREPEDHFEPPGTSRIEDHVEGGAGAPDAGRAVGRR